MQRLASTGALRSTWPSRRRPHAVRSLASAFYATENLVENQCAVSGRAHAQIGEEKDSRGVVHQFEHLPQSAIDFDIDVLDRIAQLRFQLAIMQRVRRIVEVPALVPYGMGLAPRACTQCAHEVTRCPIANGLTQQLRMR